MNNTFNGKRFVAYAVKHYAENSKAYMWMLLALFVALFGFRWVLTMSKESPANIFNYSLIVGGFFMLQIIERSMRVSTKKIEQTVSFTLPVSALEKYLFAWLNSITLFFTAFILVFCLVKTVFPWMTGLPSNPLTSISDKLAIPNILFAVFFIHSILFFSNTCFRYPRIGYVIVFVAFYTLYGIARLPHTLEWSDYIYPFIEIEQSLKQGETSLIYNISWIKPGMYIFTSFCILYMVPITFWICGYYKTKERQIK